MVILSIIIIVAIIVALYAVEDFFRGSMPNDRIDQIVVILFAIFLLLLAAVIKYAW